MQKEQLAALAETLRAFPAAERREFVERAMLIANGSATMADIDSFRFDWSNTWNDHAHSWNDEAIKK
jgi:hypothetical protein